MKKLFQLTLVVLSFIVLSACQNGGDEPVTPQTPQPKPAETEQKSDGPFEIEILDLHSSYCTVHVVPDAPSEHYIWYGVTTEEFFLEYGSYEDVKSSVDEYVKAVISNNSETPVEEMVKVGEFSEKVKGLLPESRIVVFACYVNESGEVTSDVELVVVTTPPVTPSKNRFKIEVNDITASSAKLRITPSNNDSYVWLELPDYIYHGMTNEQIKEFLLKHYTPFFSVRSHNGVVDFDFEDALEANTEYMIIVFGYDGGMTTDLTTHRFMTGDAGDASLVTFEVEYLEVTNLTVRLTITPSDPSVPYLAIVADQELLDEHGGATPEGVKTLLDAVIDEAIRYGDCKDRAEFAQYYARRATSTGSFSLLPGMKHYTCAVALDPDGEFASEVFIDGFTPPGEVATDASVRARFTNHFDGDALSRIDAENYGEYAGMAVLPVDFTLEGSAVQAIYTLFDVATLESEQATEADIIDSMLNEELMDRYNFYVQPRVDLLLEWDTDYKLFMIAMDYNQNISRLIELPISALSRDAVSPIETYEPINGGELPLGTSVSVHYESYFDGSALAALDRELYGRYDYWAVLPVEFTLGQTAQKAYYMYLDEYTYGDIPSDEYAVQLLLDESNIGDLTAYAQGTALLKMEWGLMHRLYVVAVDAEGNPGSLIKIDIDPLLLDNASPVEEFPL